MNRSKSRKSSEDRKRMIMILLMLMIVLTPDGKIFAHRMVIEELEAGLVKVGYDDGRFSRRTEIVVYDEKGTELQRGMIDASGQFSFSPEQAALIVADDGIGHRAEMALGAEVLEEKPRGLTVSLVFIAFLTLSGIFQYRVSSRQKKGEERRGEL